MLEYPMSLIAEILASGTVAVQITLGNPSFHGSNAYESVLNEIAAYERHIDVNRKYLKKATCVAFQEC